LSSGLPDGDFWLSMQPSHPLPIAFYRSTFTW
jgi:hypothetical protein